MKKFKSSDFGVIFNGGINLKISNVIVIFDIRLDLGLVNRRAYPRIKE